MWLTSVRLPIQSEDVTVAVGDSSRIELSGQCWGGVITLILTPPLTLPLAA